MTYQRQITPRSVAWATWLSRGTLQFTGCSYSLIRPWIGRSDFHVVYNGVPTERYTPRYDVKAEAPLVFLGRIERIKGVHVAIEVARRTGRRLVIAGNIPQSVEHRAYFDKEVRPHLDCPNIEYRGPVDDTAKNELLNAAAALLMPILWEEPFGIVMAEALACGTPVLGFPRGAVPEVVVDGGTGLICADTNEMVQAVAQIDSLDRRLCREAAEDRFSIESVVDGYEAIYRSVARRGPRSNRVVRARGS